jgi:hypothetical protein
LRWCCVACLFFAGCVGSGAANAPVSPAASSGAVEAAHDHEPSVNAPEIVLEGDGGTKIDGRAVGVAPQGSVTRLDAEFELLKARVPQRPHTFSLPSYLLRVADAADGAQVKSVVQTAAFAGWPLAVLQTEDGAVELNTPATGPNRLGLFFPKEMLVLVAHRESLELWRAHNERATEAHAEARAPNADQTEGMAQNLGALRLDQISTGLAQLLEGQCKLKTDCDPAILFLENGASFSSAYLALRMLAKNAASHGGQFASVELHVKEPTPAGTLPPLALPRATTVAGRLPPELIQKVVRAAYGTFRVCYEQGLSRDAKLAGSVVVRFVIARDGKVSNAALGPGSTLPDAQAAECVVKAFYGLVFPTPEAGIVTVVYPIMLSPG